ALRQDVEQRSAAVARPSRPPSGSAHARKPDGAPPAARALALAARARNRRAQSGACGRGRAHRRTHLRRKAQCAAAAPRDLVGRGGLKGALPSALNRALLGRLFPALVELATCASTESQYR